MENYKKDLDNSIIIVDYIFKLELFIFHTVNLHNNY